MPVLIYVTITFIINFGFEVWQSPSFFENKIYFYYNALLQKEHIFLHDFSINECFKACAQLASYFRCDWKNEVIQCVESWPHVLSEPLTLDVVERMKWSSV